MKPIFNLIYVLLFVAGFSSHAQISNTKSYQVSIDFKHPVSTNTETIPDDATATVSAVYFDGLGRPVQQNSIKAGGDKEDLVKHIEYNLNGDNTKEYLPVPSNQSSGAYLDNVKDLTNSFYNVPEYEYTLNPYAEKVLEKSPERKVLAQGFPGNDWDPNKTNNHAVKFDYKTNTDADAVKKFTVTTTFNGTEAAISSTISENGTYAANELYKNIVKDENWVSGVNNTTEEFKNKLGQVVLKRAYNNNTAHDTYYAYDVYGNLAYVIPPLANGSIAGDNLDKLCYQYRYDAKDRLTEKKLPQKDWEFMIYDKADRLVMSGPVANPFGEASRGWLVNKYDVFGRVIYTGYYPDNVFNSIERNTLAINNFTTESKTAGNTTIDGITTRYTNTSFPTTFKLLTVNYYDDYNFPNAPASFSAVENQPVNTAVLGQLTGGWTRILTTATSTAGNMSYVFYDNKYRPIRTYSQNHLGGYTQVDSNLSFTGLPITTTTTQKQNSSAPSMRNVDYYTYDHQEREVTHMQNLNGIPGSFISNKSYDGLGNLNKKGVGGMTAGLQRINYKYNIRGWLTDINDTSLLNDDADLFSEKIFYNKPKKLAFATGAPLSSRFYNGNISYVETKTRNDNTSKGYRFYYDHLNRLTDADFFDSPLLTSTISLGHYKESLSYDKNGNILSIDRNGELIDNQPIEIDELTYTYTGNQLQSVADATNNADGFNDGNKTGVDFVYDSFGNMTQDKNKGITNIKYNHLNLPVEITFATGKINYLYDALGTKLQKTVTPATGTAVVTDYVNGFQYENNVLQFFPHAEGYVKPNGNNSYLYVYQYKDHLGNVRLSYADIDGSGTIEPATEILEENNYYPFGLKHKGYNEIANSNRSEAAEKYKFQGQERNEELGLNWDSFKWRNYDYAIGRFFNIDMLAEEYSYQSPYNFSENRVIDGIELEGLERLSVHTPNWIYGTQTIRNSHPTNAQMKTATAAVVARHPIAAHAVGSVEKGGTNISSISGRIARHAAENNNMSIDEGSERNALRHTIWSGAMTSKFGENIAQRIGNAHEGIPLSAQKNAHVDFGQPAPTNLGAADSVVDFLNNAIGRQIGLDLGSGATEWDIAVQALDVQLNEGLWTAKKDENGDITISRTKITQDQYKTAMKNLNILNRYGMNDEDRNELNKSK